MDTIRFALDVFLSLWKRIRVYFAGEIQVSRMIETDWLNAIVVAAS